MSEMVQKKKKAQLQPTDVDNKVIQHLGHKVMNKVVLHIWKLRKLRKPSG